MNYDSEEELFQNTLVDTRKEVVLSDMIVQCIKKYCYRLLSIEDILLKIFQDYLENVNEWDINLEEVYPTSLINKKFLKVFRCCSQRILIERKRYYEWQHDYVLPIPINIHTTNDEKELFGRKVIVYDTDRSGIMRWNKVDLFNLIIKEGEIKAYPFEY